LFSIGVWAHFDPERLANHVLERRGVPLGRPQLELGIAARPHLQQRILAAVVKVDPRDDLRVAPIEVFRKAEHRRQRADDPAPAAPEVAESDVTALRRRPPMVPRDQGNRFDLERLEAAQIAVLDQVVRVLVVLLVADMDAGVVQDRAVLQPFALLRVRSNRSVASLAMWCAWSGQ
jgi:hypothetical protein